MTVSWLYLAAALVGVWFTKQALWPVPLPKRRSIPSFFAAWMTNELAVHHIAWQAVATMVFVLAGALDAWPGWVALGLTVVSWVGMLRLQREALRAGPATEQALRDALGDDYRDRLPPSDEPYDGVAWRSLVIPFRIRHPEVTRRREVVFGRAGGRDLRCDVVAPRRDGENRPALVYVHGGGWVLGFRERQGLPLMHELAARGWVCVNIDYRLSPWATFPEHLEDVKRAIAWVREHADDLGVDPGFVAVAGNSAGAHLAALAALTPDRPELQPGFEDADTRLQACVSMYGVYDFTNRAGHHAPDMMSFLARNVMKATIEDDPARYRLASPMDQVTADAPPFLVIHGDRDTLTPLAEARAFAAALREVSQAPVADVCVPGAEHAFDTFPSTRTALVLRGVARFLAYVHHTTTADLATGATTTHH